MLDLNGCEVRGEREREREIEWQIRNVWPLVPPSTATLAHVPGPTKVDLHGINIFITLDQLHVKNASSCRLGSAPVQIGSSHVTLILSAPHRPDTLKLGRNCWAALDFGPQNGDALEKTHPSSNSWVPFHLQKSGPYGHLKWLELLLGDSSCFDIPKAGHVLWCPLGCSGFLWCSPRAMPARSLGKGGDSEPCRFRFGMSQKSAWVAVSSHIFI